MNGRIVILLGMTLIASLLGVFASEQDVQAAAANEMIVVAASDGDDAESSITPSDKKGKYWFKKTCKSCHGKDGDGGEITPISKTIKQWERYFEKDAHQGEEMLSKTFDAEQLIHIRAFLINHAADSDQPETCG